MGAKAPRSIQSEQYPQIVDLEAVPKQQVSITVQEVPSEKEKAKKTHPSYMLIVTN